MWQWLNHFRGAIAKARSAVEEPFPPVILTHSAPRSGVVPALPYPLAVDGSESRLFYRSMQGNVVCRTIASGEMVWESQNDGYPLRVSDDILWAVQGDAIIAYSAGDGQRLMRSQPLWLPGRAAYTLCDLSKQTLRIYSQYCPSPPNVGTPHPHPPPEIDEAAYEINLITGEVATLYQVTICPYNLRQSRDSIFEPERNIVPRISETLFKAVQNQSIVERRQSLEDYCREARKAYHWPDQREIEQQAYGGGRSRRIVLQTAVLVIDESLTEKFAIYRTTLSVLSSQPPYSKQWDAILEEQYREPPHC